MYSLPTGPPGDISDVNIPPDTITACSFVVQWSRPSSDPVCGSVWYTVTVTEGGMLIMANTTQTNSHVTGLTNNTSYFVTVTASNNAGNSSGATTVSIMTNSKSTIPMHMYVCSYVLMKSPFVNIMVFVTYFIPCI